MRLKSWESPRRQGRNDKGRGGSARSRQLRKQQQQLRRKLKENQQPNQKPNQNSPGGSKLLLPSFYDWVELGELFIHISISGNSRR